jgi:5-methylcytosine-specific restriction endonuclease McrA
MSLLRKVKEIYHSKHLHFLFVDYKMYKKWKWIIRLAVSLNKGYISCEIFRKKYKIHENIVIIGLKWNGKNPKRRTNGYAKEFVSNNSGSVCIYCEELLTLENATSDHIIPISRKGNNCQVNIIICCNDCNNERGQIPFIDYLKMKNKKYKGRKDIFI